MRAKEKTELCKPFVLFHVGLSSFNLCNQYVSNINIDILTIL